MIDQAEIDGGAHLPVDTIAARWGEANDAGFTPVPNELLRAQAKLGLSATELVVVLNLMLHWWHRDRLPYPRTSAIAKRTGLSARTVQRCLRELEKKGLVARHRGRTKLKGTRYEKQRAHYDLSGLRERLATLARGDRWYRPDVVRLAPAGTERRARSGVQTREPEQP